MFVFCRLRFVEDFARALRLWWFPHQRGIYGKGSLLQDTPMPCGIRCRKSGTILRPLPAEPVHRFQRRSATVQGYHRWRIHDLASSERVHIRPYSLLCGYSPVQCFDEISQEKPCGTSGRKTWCINYKALLPCPRCPSHISNSEQLVSERDGISDIHQAQGFQSQSYTHHYHQKP